MKHFLPGGFVAGLVGLMALAGTASTSKAWELEAVYDSALYFFDRQQFGQAYAALERVDPAFHPEVVEQLRMLSLLADLEQRTRRSPPWNMVSASAYEGLVQAGLNSEALYRGVCDAALKEAALSMFRLCASAVPGFSGAVDQAIAGWLQSWYEDPGQKADFPQPLRPLINPGELQAGDADLQLVRQRLVAWLQTNDCRSRFRCPLYTEPIRPLVRAFIFGSAFGD